MKKKFRLMNRGVLFLGFLILGVCVFLFIAGIMDKKLEPKLQLMAEEFIDSTKTAPIIPEELRLSNRNFLSFDDSYDFVGDDAYDMDFAFLDQIPYEYSDKHSEYWDYGYDLIDEIFEDYMSQNQNLLDRFLPEEVLARRFAMNWLEESYYFQFDNNFFITGVNLQILQFKRFSVYQNEASLTCVIQYEITTVDHSGDTEEHFFKREEKILFIKDGADWFISRYSPSVYSYDLIAQYW